MASEDLFQVNNSEKETLEQIEDSSRKEQHDGDDANPACSEEHVVVDDPTTNDEPRGETAPQSADEIVHKLTQLPMGRIRNLMKLDPDLRLASNESVFAITRATELFIASLAREAYTHTVQAKKKTVQKRDVDLAIATVDSLMFLDGAMK